MLWPPNPHPASGGSDGHSQLVNEETSDVQRGNGNFRPGCQAQVRLTHHLALLYPRCWAAVDQLPQVEGCEAVPGVPGGLQSLVLPPPALLKLRANHRAAIRRLREAAETNRRT
jgi:hypothetical protein